MKIRNISGILIILLGILIYVLDKYFEVFGNNNPGFFALHIGLPLLLVGVFLFFSYVASIMIFLGFAIQPFWNNTLTITLGMIIVGIGVIYGLVEGIIKFISNPEQQTTNYPYSYINNQYKIQNNYN